MRRPRVATLLALAVALAAAPVAVGAGFTPPTRYSVKVAGSQTVQWHFNGDVRVGGCGVGVDNVTVLQTGAGTGALTFRFANAKPGVAVASAFGPFSFAFDTKAKATGTMTGSLAFTNGRTCQGFAPPDDYTATTSACGAQTFRLNVQGQWKAGFLRFWGDDDILFAATPSRYAYDDCPLPLNAVRGLAVESSGTTCETKRGAPLWLRTNELDSAAGRGLANVRFATTPKSLLHPKTRVTTLARTVVKNCNIKLSNSDAPLVVDVTTKLTVTLRRQG